jgi:4-amino-4-deoxy-L-arabinose transferase-like glycosyltransferase
VSASAAEPAGTSVAGGRIRARGPDRLGLIIAALAVAVRLLWVLAVPTHPVGDFAMYLESADYLVAHGSLDPEFIYMPGYVLLLAAVRALGGGLFAAKLLGVAAGGLATAAVYGTAGRVFDRRSAIAAGLLAALWPAGIAVSSVIGTDMPAGALLAAAIWLLVRDADARPWRAAIAFGVTLGLAAYVRAVALPIALLAGFYWAALRVPLRQVVLRTALGCAVAAVTLLPWGIRNAMKYGELFLTDSHGGHTALVGANPNSEGVYSRSLNRMFAEGTGYQLFAPPHRDADRAAYALARRWTAFEPDYALGLLGAKADRLLTNERPLLYWPLYRQGVLSGETERWFARHRAGIEWLVDGFWYALCAGTLAGAVVAASRRLWPALALLPVPLALAAVYVAFFAEVRYHLAIAVLLFPFAGAAVRWAGQGTRDLRLRRLNARGRRRFGREALGATLVIGAVFGGWLWLLDAAAQLRARHRWGVCVCTVQDQRGLCAFRPTAPPPGEGVSPVRGVWNGIGLALTTEPASAATDIELPPGRYRISARADAAGGAARPSARLELRAREGTLGTAMLPRPTGDPPVPLAGVVDHLGGSLRIEVAAQALSTPSMFVDVPTLWISDIQVEGPLR